MRLPRIAVVDTGVLMLGLGDRPSDPRAEHCKWFLKEMESREYTVVVPTIVFTEIMRGAVTKASKERGAALAGLRHKLSSWVIKDFDLHAAEHCGREFSHEYIKESVKRTFVDGSVEKTPIDYLKYDALIVATALSVYNVGAIVSIDANDQKPGMVRFCRKVDVPVVTPTDIFKTEEELAQKSSNHSREIRLEEELRQLNFLSEDD